VSEDNPIRVFATHSFDESDDYLRVFEFLEGVDRFYYLNVSKPENIPTTGGLEAIKDELIRQIKACEAVFVLPSVYEQKEDLVRFMMDVADANNKNMIVRLVASPKPPRLLLSAPKNTSSGMTGRWPTRCVARRGERTLHDGKCWIFLVLTPMGPLISAL